MSIESILRKLIAASMFKGFDENYRPCMLLHYEDDVLMCPLNDDESLTKAIDLFYYTVIQLEMKVEEG